jgi:hypothetical protein
MSEAGEVHARPAPPPLSEEAAAARKDQLNKDLARAKEAGWYAQSIRTPRDRH